MCVDGHPGKDKLTCTGIGGPEATAMLYPGTSGRTVRI